MSSIEKSSPSQSRMITVRRESTANILLSMEQDHLLPPPDPQIRFHGIGRQGEVDGIQVRQERLRYHPIYTLRSRSNPSQANPDLHGGWKATISLINQAMKPASLLEEADCQPSRVA